MINLQIKTRTTSIVAFTGPLFALRTRLLSAVNISLHWFQRAGIPRLHPIKSGQNGNSRFQTSTGHLSTPHANDPDDAAKQFVVECKRLTKPWAVYTREYVKSGIARFISAGHGYGKGMPSGAMVGYLQEIALNDALNRVNAVAVSDSIPPLFLQGRDAETSAELAHDLVRPYPEAPFHLMHLWARVGPTQDL